MALKMKEEYKPLFELLNELTGARSLWQVFQDCITMLAISIQNSFARGFCFGEMLEKQYTDIAGGYSKKELEIMCKVFGEIVMLAENKPFQDLLGDLYMRLNMGAEAIGQFFTPYNIAVMGAKTVLREDDVKKRLSEKGNIVIFEPTVGGGANLIAACEVLNSYGINYQNRNVVFVAQELSRLTAMMCYISLSLIGANAIIKVGDTLINPYTSFADEWRKRSELWITPAFAKNDCFRMV